jgi:hypothetical protein
MTRQCRLVTAIATAILVACVCLGVPSTAQADGTKIFVGAGNPLGLHPMPPVPQPPQRPSWQQRPSSYPYAYLAPVWPAGYWSYVWVPQAYTAWVLVPGGWAAAGSWLDAHYEPRVYEGGYYQQVWVGAVPSP